MNGRKAVENQLRNRACMNKSKKYFKKIVEQEYFIFTWGWMMRKTKRDMEWENYMKKK